MTSRNHSSRTRSRDIRERMATTGESYAEAARKLTQHAPDPAAVGGQPAPGPGPAPAIFDPSDTLMKTPWATLVERLDRYEDDLENLDPCVRAGAFEGRARVYDELAASTTGDGDVYRMACYRSAILDKSSAARVRFLAGIPTLFPRTEQTLLGLSTCDWCGRPWQVSAEGACPRCPRMLFGPTPSSRQDAADSVAPLHAAPLSDRHEIRDVLSLAIQTDGSGCDHAEDGACADCLADLVLTTLATLPLGTHGPVTMRPDHDDAQG